MAKQLAPRWHTCLPQHALSVFVGWLATRRWRWCKDHFIAWFIKRYNVDLSEAKQPDYRQYKTFNAFFTRHLQPTARPIDARADTLVAPVDGVISEMGKLMGDRILQAKDRFFSLSALMGHDSECTQLFTAGSFMTLYLAPRDYHRVHMPIAGRLLRMLHVPGRLFSVNPNSVLTIDDVFARNERVVCLFETAVGPMAIVMVGAMLVGSIVTQWQGQVTPPTGKKVRYFDYRERALTLERAAEMGYFQMGSTVILLFGHSKIVWNQQLRADHAIKLGEMIAHPA